ncbi:helix-turn-helix domain-containing protein [Lactococcus lactis]|uniref:helix-turn-helix domain-containing protein n=1 Tax=Lactococcus lactis TaxID=1358 RepID=UPI0019114872|nr:helix-turn-helix transcriptional regulator [Lactococcus lactis]WDA68727.1 helix-turn-helix transcriptional regulator [Lactococcus lactis]
METIAERLVHLRHSHNLSRKQVREALGFLETTYARWEKGNRVPDNETVLKFAQFYQVSPLYMLGFSHLQDEADFLAEVLEHISENGDPDGTYARFALEEARKNYMSQENQKIEP